MAIKRGSVGCPFFIARPNSLAENLLQVPFGCTDRGDVEVLNQEVEHVRRDEGRKLGPSLMFLMPRWSRVRRMATAFCSYQERIMDSGRSFTPQLKAPAKATAIWIAE